MALATAFVEIGVDFAEMRKQLSKAKGEFSAKVKDIQGNAMGAGKSIGKSLGAGIKTGLKVGIAGLTALIAAGGLAVKSFITSQKESLRLAKVLKATGNAAGFTAEQLEENAQKLQDATTFDDTDIKTSQALIASFTNITGENFKKATKAALDMTALMGGDLRSNTIQLAKALSDPVKGLTGLARSGVIFTEQQKRMIKTMAETGRVAEAQTEIFSILSKNGVDGNADATGALADQWEQFKNVFEDVLVLLGEGVAEIFGLNTQATGLVDLMKDLRKSLEDFKKEGGFKELARDLGGVFRLIGGAINRLIGGFKVLGAGIQLLTDGDLAKFDRTVAEVGKSMDDWDEKINKLFRSSSDGSKKQEDQAKKQKDANEKLKAAIEARIAALKEQLELDKKGLADAESQLEVEKARLATVKKIEGVKTFGLEQAFAARVGALAERQKQEEITGIESMIQGSKALIKTFKDDIKTTEKKLRAEGIEKAAMQQVKNQEIQIELQRQTLRAVENQNSSVFMKE
jgi:hypothetical protein